MNENKQKAIFAWNADIGIAIDAYTICFWIQEEVIRVPDSLLFSSIFFPTAAADVFVVIVSDCLQFASVKCALILTIVLSIR